MPSPLAFPSTPSSKNRLSTTCPRRLRVPAYRGAICFSTHVDKPQGHPEPLSIHIKPTACSLPPSLHRASGVGRHSGEAEGREWVTPNPRLLCKCKLHRTQNPFPAQHALQSFPKPHSVCDRL